MRTPAILFRRTLTRTALVGGLVCLPAALQAQILAPAGPTLFNRAVIVRSSIRLDTFDENISGVMGPPRKSRHTGISRLSRKVVKPCVRLSSSTKE